MLWPTPAACRDPRGSPGIGIGNGLVFLLALWLLTPLPGWGQPPPLRSHPDGFRYPGPKPDGSRPPKPGEGREPDAPVAPGDPSRRLSAAEVLTLVDAAARALDSPDLTIAVADRMGRPLGLYRRPRAPIANDDLALGLARTAALFSNNQAPLSSRTVRFLSGIHFPPGIRNTPNAALYGIENTNRGCDLQVPFNPGKEVPQALSLVIDAPCNSQVQDGCGPGPVTGKVQPFDDDFRAVNPGGVPVFKLTPAGELLAVGGIGVAGVPAPDAEFAAAQAAFPNGLPDFLPPPQRVLIDGVRLPFVDQITRPSGTRPGAGVTSADLALGPRAGGPTPDGYLVGPRGGSRLSRAEVERIVDQSVAAANRTRAVIRLPLGSRARMVIAVADTDGDILALFRMPDSTIFSIDVAATKARNVVYFSSLDPGVASDLPGVPPGTAISNRTLSFGAQPLYPPGIDGSGPGPFFDLFVHDLANPCSQGSQAKNPFQSGIVFFPGSSPLYRGGELAGGLGISGDGVEQDDYVTFLGGRGFLPEAGIRADEVILLGVRLPFFKFPRNPEG